MGRVYRLYFDQARADWGRHARRCAAVMIVVLHLVAIAWLLRVTPIAVGEPASLIVVELNALASATRLHGRNATHDASAARAHAAERPRRADASRAPQIEGRLAPIDGDAASVASPAAANGSQDGSTGAGSLAAHGHFRPPRVLHRWSQAYPPEALAAHAEGSVDVIVTVAADGTLLDAHVDRSSGNADLDAAAVAAVQRYTFKAGENDGQPIRSQAIVVIEWHILPNMRSDIAQGSQTRLGTLQFLGSAPPDVVRKERQ